MIIKRNLPHPKRAFLTLLTAFFSNSNVWLAICTAFLVIIGVCTLRIQRDMEIKQLSAFVTVNDLRIDKTIDENHVLTHLTLTPIIENSGETAVRSGNYVLWGAHWHGPDNQVAPQSPTGLTKTFITPSDGMHLSFGPRSKQETTLSSLGLNGNLSELTTGQRTIYLSGQILYKDVFGYCPLTKFCFIVGKIIPNSVKDDISTEFCTENTNCTDDECIGFRPC
jgi:hypothetical protein